MPTLATPFRSVAATVLIGILNGCLFAADEPPSTEMKEHATALEEVFDDLAARELIEWRESDWCRYIAYDGGRYSEASGSGCNSALMRIDQPEGILEDEASFPALDTQAEEGFDAVAQILNATDLSVQEASLRYLEDGSVDWAVFVVDSGGAATWQYHYCPGCGDFEPYTEGDHRYTPINNDWYFMWVEWM